MTRLTDSSTLNYSGSVEDQNPRVGGITLGGWLAIGVVSLLLIATFRFNLVRLWGKINPFGGDAEWQHAVAVPLIGIYYLYIHREELEKAKVEPLLVGGFTKGRWIGALGLVLFGLFTSTVGPLVMPGQASILSSTIYLFGILAVLVMALNWGLAMMVFGLLFFGYGIYPGQNDYFKDLGMVCTIFGATLTLCGWGVMRIAWFPIAFLICALPWPGLFYSWVALPLQELAAKVAAILLSMTGIDSYHSGSKIHIGNQTLNVAEACAGLKSLMTFVTVGAAVAFLSSRPLWQKLLMTFSAVPIAIFCNVLRVTVQGLLHHHAGPEWSENFAHQFVGMVMLVPAFFLILLFGWVLDQLFEEEVDEEVTKAATEAAMATARSQNTAADLLAPAVQTATAEIPATQAARIPVRTVKANTAAAIEERINQNSGTTTTAATLEPSAAPITSIPVPPPASRPSSPTSPRPRGFVPPAYVPPSMPTSDKKEGQS